MTDFNIWEGVFSSFGETGERPQDINERRWIERVEARARAVRDRLAAGRADDPVSTFHQYILPVVAAMLSPAGKPLQVIDFGGGMGISFAETAAVLRGVDLKFHVVELPAMAGPGRRLFADDRRVHFHDSLMSCPHPVNLIHLGSSLQYIDDWRGLIGTLAAFQPEAFVLSDMAVGDIGTFVTRQTFYGGSQAARFFNRNELCGEFIRHGYRVVFDAPYRGIYLGDRCPLPMDNLPPENRICDTRHLVLVRS